MQVTRGKQVRQNDGEDAGKKDSVERSGPADRRNRRAKAAHFVEVCKIGPASQCSTKATIAVAIAPLNHKFRVVSR